MVSSIQQLSFLPFQSSQAFESSKSTDKFQQSSELDQFPVQAPTIGGDMAIDLHPNEADQSSLDSEIEKSSDIWSTVSKVFESETNSFPLPINHKRMIELPDAPPAKKQRLENEIPKPFEESQVLAEGAVINKENVTDKLEMVAVANQIVNPLPVFITLQMPKFNLERLIPIGDPSKKYPSILISNPPVFPVPQQTSASLGNSSRSIHGERPANPPPVSKSKKKPTIVKRQIKPSRKARIVWSEYMDSCMLKAMAKTKLEDYRISWIAVSEELQERSIFVNAHQCHNRYKKVLNPDLDRSPLSDQEKEFIRVERFEHNKSWKIIAKELNANLAQLNPSIPAGKHRAIIKIANLFNRVKKGEKPPVKVKSEATSPLEILASVSASKEQLPAPKSSSQSSLLHVKTESHHLS